MKLIIAIDSFKGSITSFEANEMAAKAAKDVFGKEAVLAIFPLADGGEGTMSALCTGLGGEILTRKVTGPLGNPIKADFGILPDKKTAVIEMAAAVGLALVPPEKRNPLHTTTYGLGELILEARKKGCRHFIIGIGGSATNDCGLGMLSALGAKFFDASGKKVGIFGRDLEFIASFSEGNLSENIAGCTFSIACDVDNPLCGPRGCSQIFAPQKGASPAIVEKMDKMIEKFSLLLKKNYHIGNALEPGAGAAGGLGYAFAAFLPAHLLSGTEIVLKALNVKEALPNADYLITGEGCLDAQTSMGKAPYSIASLAKREKPQIKTIAFCGCAKNGAQCLNEGIIDAYFPILRSPLNKEAAMEKETAKDNLYKTAVQVFRLLLACQK